MRKKMLFERARHGGCMGRLCVDLLLWDETIAQTVRPNEPRFSIGGRGSTAGATSQTDRGCGQGQGHSGMEVVDSYAQLIQASRNLGVEAR